MPTIKSRKVKNVLSETHDIKAKIKEGEKKKYPRPAAKILHEKTTNI